MVGVSTCLQTVLGAVLRVQAVALFEDIAGGVNASDTLSEEDIQQEVTEAYNQASV